MEHHKAVVRGLGWLFMGLLTGKVSFVMFQALKKGWKLYPEKKKGFLLVNLRKKRKPARKKSKAA